MSGLYLLLFAGLMLAGFALGRWRAQAVAGGRYAEMHSLPSYHGLFVVCGVFAPMLAIFVIGTPLTAKLASSAALAELPAEVQQNPLRSRRPPRPTPRCTRAAPASCSARDLPPGCSRSPGA